MENQDQYQSTNKLPENPYPERSQLLLEGIIDIDPSEYVAYPGSSGFYVKNKGIDVTRLIQLGNRIKGFPPKTLSAEVWHDSVSVGGGQIDDRYRPLPILEMSAYNALAVKQHTWFEFVGQYITGDDIAGMFFSIIDVRNALPTRVQSFSYKIYATTYDFTNTV